MSKIRLFSVVAVFVLASLASVCSATLTDGLAGYWSFDNPQDMGADSSGNGLNGTVYGAGSDPGVVGIALSLDGSNDYIALPDNSFDNIGSSVTLSAWIKRDRVGIQENVFGYGDGGSGRYYMQFGVWEDQTIIYGIRRSQTYDYCSWLGSTRIEQDQWYHIAVTTNGSETKAYINGHPEVFTKHPGSVCSNTWSFPQISNYAERAAIGTLPRSSNAIYFNGMIDELRIYDRYLSAAEVAQLVPEPATLMLLVVGGLIAGRRRRCCPPTK